MATTPSGRYVGPYAVTHSRPVYENPWIKVREDKATHRDGTESVFGIVTVKPMVAVLPLAEDGAVSLVREFRYALGEDSLEVISGGIESGETPDVAALRELDQAAGLTASEWIDMGVVNPMTTLVNAPHHLFLCRGLAGTRRVRTAAGRPEIVTMPLDDALYAVLRGEITDAASCVLILKAKRFLEKPPAKRQRR